MLNFKIQLHFSEQIQQVESYLDGNMKSVFLLHCL